MFETYVADGNAAAVAHVAAAAAGGRRDVVWLCGPAGTGKTHLLQAACRDAGGRGRRVMYVALGPGGQQAHPDQLLGLEGLDLLALDDVDAVAGRADWEARLFTVFNHGHSQGGTLLLAGRPAPAGAAFALSDLASRAAGAVVYRLVELDETGRVDALRRQARLRGLELDAPAAQFLLNRVRRGMPELCGWLDRLDEASLAAQRKLTIPFIRRTLSAEIPE